jgi:hypothetical protein
MKLVGLLGECERTLHVKRMLTFVTAMAWICNVPHRLMCRKLGPQLVALFWEAVETRKWGLAGEEGHWGVTFKIIPGPCSPPPLISPCFLSAMRWTASATHSYCHDVLPPYGPRINGARLWTETSEIMNQNKSFHLEVVLLCICHRNKKAN